MQALLFYGNRDLRFEQLENPEPAEGELGIAITDAGLSQATVAEFIEGPFIIGSDPHPRTGLAMPLIPCQEFGGVVDAVGSGVDPAMMGKTGAVLPSQPCGECQYCQSGRDNLCTTLSYRGLVGAHGGFVERTVVPVRDFFEVTPNILPNMVEPLLVSIHAIEQLKHNRHDLTDETVLILGAGCIGLCLASILKDIYGVSVQLTDPLPNRLTLASEQGFETIPTESLNDYNGGFSVVVDAAGKELNLERQALDQAIDLCSAGGCILAIGTYFISLEFQPARFLFQELAIVPSFAYCLSDVKELDRIQANLKLDFSQIVTQVPFSDIIDEGFFRAELDRNAFTRITTAPSRSSEQAQKNAA